jgi:hypothetical protein
MRPIRDIDIYWHQVLGEEILTTGEVTGIGDAWAWYDPEPAWTTSQWLSEVLIALLVRLGDWDALVLATMVATGVLLLLLGWVILQRTDARSGVLVFAPVALSLLLYVDVRPLLLSTVATLVVAHAAERTLVSGQPPPWWSLTLIALWSNLHGQWVVVPLAIGLAGLLHRLGNG